MKGVGTLPALQIQTSLLPQAQQHSQPQRITLQQTNPESNGQPRRSSPEDIDRALPNSDGEEGGKFVSPRDGRKIACQVFDSWLNYQNRKKAAWEKMIRHNFQKDMKTKKECFHAWLCYLKTKKILRLQYTLVSHNNYKHRCRLVFKEL